MIELLLAVAGAWSALRLFGADRRWPGRFAQLEPSSRHRGQLHRGIPAAASAPGASRRAPARCRPERPSDRDLDADLPATIDLLRLALSAGHTPHTAILALEPLASGPVGAAFAHVADEVRRGASMVDALAGVTARVGERAAPLVTTLTVALAAGSPLGPLLERLGEQERRRARRSVERRVRRLPVLLLAPLVGLILPAFVVLTIVPVAVTNAASAGHLLTG